LRNNNGSTIQSKNKTTYGNLYTYTADTVNDFIIYGNDGGKSNIDSSDISDAMGGGGGGAGAVGYNGYSSGNEGVGGVGVDFSITFTTNVGVNGFFGGGGGGGGDNGAGNGGLGGGGNGGGLRGGLPLAQNATNHTGGGGGGVQWAVHSASDPSGAGGSGIVIIRYKTTKIVPSTVQQTGILNYTNMNGWSLSQVSEGTTNILDLTVGTLRMSAGTFHTGAGRNVFLFDTDGRSYYRGHNNIPHTWSGTANTIIMELLNSGNLRSIGAYTNTSDIRIKRDIVDIDDTEGLEKILLIQPKKYKYIDTSRGETEVIGFIAQDILQIIPEAVDFGERQLPNDGETVQDFHYLDKAMIFTLNVCATQELHRMLVRQQQVIDSLIARIEALEGV